jgi:hypothetical protein
VITPAYLTTATERVLPRLALDFTTGVLDPRVTVARALNTATCVNSSGFIEVVNANLPRFDYDPVTLAPKGLLIEETRANLFLHSNDLSNAVWAPIGAKNVATDNVNLSPDGTLNAIILTDNSTTAFQGVGQTVTVANNSASYAHSCYIRKTSGGTSPTFGVNYNLTGGTAVNNPVRINTDTGAVLQGSTTTVVDSGSFWRVISTTTNNSTGNTSLVAQYYPAVAPHNSTSLSISVVGSATLYGSQLEAGAFATSYIPTTTTSLTRNADVVSMTGTNFSDWYNVGAGSWFIQTNARSGDTILTAGGFTLTADATALKKYADAYSSDQSASSLVFGNGTVAKVSYYKQALLAAELQALRA